MLDTDAVVRVATEYEKFIGPINQSSAMKLKGLCEDYTEENLIKAIQAAGRARAGWRYIEVTCENLSKETTPDPDKFVQGNYGSLVMRGPEDYERVMKLRESLKYG